jgi:hypothetical protein
VPDDTGVITPVNESMAAMEGLLDDQTPPGCVELNPIKETSLTARTENPYVLAFVPLNKLL